MLKRIIGQVNTLYAKWDESTPGFSRWKPNKIRSSSTPIAIYVLVDPRDGTVRYVGKTTSPERRIKQHRKAGPRKSNGDLCAWRVELATYGFQIRMHVVDWVAKQRWEEAERRWISYYASIGIIYNISSGGQHFRRAVEKPTETRLAQYRDAMRRQKRRAAKKVDRFFSRKDPLPKARLDFGECPE